MRLNGSNIGTFLKSGQNRPFFHPLFLENFKTTFFQKLPMDILYFGHFGFRGTILNGASGLFNGHKKSLDFVQDHCANNSTKIKNLSIFGTF